MILILPDLHPLGTHGKFVLQSLIADYKTEYEDLTPEEREVLIRAFEENRSNIATAKRISVKAQVNDVSSTLVFIETEVPTCIFYSDLFLYERLSVEQS